MLKVRQSHPDDAADIEALIALYVPDGTLLPRTAAFIAERHEDFLVAVEDRRIVGCVHLDEYAPSLAEIRSLAVVAGLGVSIATAQDEHAAGGAEAEHATQHFPINHPREQEWSFAGPFGKYDRGQLQRGLKVYTEVCAACHSMNLVAFRTLGDLGYSEAQVKTFAANYEVQDGPNADGEMFTRPAIPSDHFPSPFPNKEAAAAANNGAAPPDFSLIAKARATHRGFPGFVVDAFAGYSEAGPDYIHALLLGYEEPPADAETVTGKYYNPVFLAGPWIAMPPPLSDGAITYTDGTPETLEQYAADVSAFLMWAAEPKLEERYKVGARIIIFLIVFAEIMYLSKRAVWARLRRRDRAEAS